MAYGSILNQTPQIDLSNYVTQEQFSTAISNLNSAVANINGPMTVYTGNGTYTFTAQNAGVYKVYAVSKGGDGGDGVSFDIQSYRNFTTSTGGGSGAIAIFQLNLQANESISVSITSTEVNINNGQVILTNGRNGSGAARSTSSGVIRSGGTGGTVSSTIDLLYSSPGTKASDSSSTQPGSYENTYLGGKGASLPTVALYPAIYGDKLGFFVSKGEDGQAPYYIYNNENTYGEKSFSGYAGVGGDGGGSVSSRQGASRGLGAEGGPAAVIIEYLGNIT